MKYEDMKVGMALDVGDGAPSCFKRGSEFLVMPDNGLGLWVICSNGGMHSLAFMADSDGEVVGFTIAARMTAPTVVEDHEQMKSEGKPFGAYWLLTVPWAHPLWSQYFIAIVDLVTPLDKPPVIARHGVTHEMMVWAVDPGKPVKKWRDGYSALLVPPNQAYQFVADNDASAVARVQALVDRIVKRELSPDTDFRKMWDAEFREDGVSLITSALEAALSVRQ